MDELTQESYLIHRRFDDFEQLADAINGWNINFRQLDHGPAQSELLQIKSGPVLLTRTHLTRQYDQHGSATPGMCTFGILEEGIKGVSWCGHQLTDQMVPCFHPSGEFHAISQPGFEVFTLTLSEELLAKVGQTLELPELRTLLGNEGKVAICDPSAMRALRGKLRELCRVLTDNPSLLNEHALRDALQQELPRLLLTALIPAHNHLPHPEPRLRYQALKHAIGYIEERQHNPLTLYELCQATKVCERTLEYAFHGHFGVCPKTYMKALRLNGTRKDLYHADPSTTSVSEIAYRWNFSHLSQLAIDYRRMFGELPSDTLKRSKA